MATRVLITGVTGQDGSLLAKHLASMQDPDGKNLYDVYGFIRKTSRPNLEPLEGLISSGRLKLLKGDILDPYSLKDAALAVMPEHVYHLADQDDIRWSSVLPSYQLDVGIKGTMNVLEPVRNYCERFTKVFIPVSATIFNSYEPQDINTATVWPTSMYGIAKSAVLNLARYYRQRYTMMVQIGAMFNHVYYDRSTEYLAPKLARAAVDLKLGRISSISLYDPLAGVDVGWAPEYVEAMRLMMEDTGLLELSIGTGSCTPIRRLWSAALVVLYPETHEMNGIEQCNFGEKYISRIAQPEGHNNNEWRADTTKAKTLIDWQAETSGEAVVQELTRHYARKEGIACK